jgi:VanZ family protein
MTVLTFSFLYAVILWVVVILVGVGADKLDAKKRYIAARWTSLVEAILCMLAAMYTIMCFMA